MSIIAVSPVDAGRVIRDVGLKQPDGLWAERGVVAAVLRDVLEWGTSLTKLSYLGV